MALINKFSLSVLGSIRSLSDKLSAGSLLYGKLYEALATLDTIDWEERNYLPLDYLNVDDELILNEILDNSGLVEGQTVVTHDGDKFAYDDLLYICRNFNGRDDWTTLLGQSEYIFDEIMDSLASAHQTSGIYDFFFKKMSEGNFSPAKLTLFLNSNYANLTSAAQESVGIISNTWDELNPFSSTISILKQITEGMSNGVVNGDTMDFDQTDYTITSIWMAIGSSTFWSTLADVLSMVLMIVGRTIGAIAFAVAQVGKAIWSAVNVEHLTVSPLPTAGEFLSIPIIQYEGYLSQYDADNIELWNSLNQLGAVSYDTAVGYFQIWPAGRTESGSFIIRIQMYPGAAGKLPHLTIIRNVSGVGSSNNYTVSTLDNEDLSSLGDYFSGVSIVLTIGGTMDNMTRRLAIRSTTTLVNEPISHPVHKWSEGIFGTQLPVSAVGQTNTWAAYASIIGSMLLLATSQLWGGSSLFSSNMYEYNYDSASWEGKPLIDMDLDHPSFSAPTYVDKIVNWIKDDVYPQYERILTDLNESVLTKDELPNFDWENLGFRNWEKKIRTLAVDLKKSLDQVTLWTSRSDNMIKLLKPDSYLRDYQYTFVSAIPARYQAASDTDYKIAGAIILATVAAVIIAIAAIGIKRAWTKRKLAKSAKLDNKTKAAAAKLQADPSSENKKAFAKAQYRQNRYFQRTGYLQGANRRGSSSPGLPEAYGSNVDDVIALIGGA